MKTECTCNDSRAIYCDRHQTAVTVWAPLLITPARNYRGRQMRTTLLARIIPNPKHKKAKP